MLVAGALLAFGGSVGCAIYGIWFLVVAFRTSIGWGLACLFIPFVPLIFAATHWEEAKRPFVTFLVAFAVCFLGGVLLASVGY